MTVLSPAKALLITVYAYLDEHYPYWRSNPEARLPAGLRMEMHPYARYVINRDEEARYWPDDLKTVFGLPVKVTPDMPDSTWRLVIVTEDVLGGGKL